MLRSFAFCYYCFTNILTPEFSFISVAFKKYDPLLSSETSILISFYTEKRELDPELKDLVETN